MQPNTTQLYAYSRMFSSTVFREMASKGKSALFARLMRESALSAENPRLRRVADAFEEAFSVLHVGAYRDEYVYKAALTHKVLLGTHSLKTACMLSEFRVGPCKADLAILNGTSTVYEIKSERDSLGRLEKQIGAYRQFFARVFVIAGENHVDAVLSAVPPDVGVMRLSKRQQISTVRNAEDRPEHVSPLAIFDAIRTSEACSILEKLGVPVPDMPNTLLHAELRKLFGGLRSGDVHAAMVSTLKRSRDLAPLSDLVNQLPASLQAAALSVGIRKADQERLVTAINTDIDVAMNWA